MLFSKFSRNKKDSGLALLIDIGSASVGAALVELRENAEIHIALTTREDIVLQEKLSAAEFLRAMNQALERALKTIQANNKTTHVPMHVFCSLSSPWFLLKNRSIEIVRKDTIVVTEAVLGAILDDDVALLREELKDSFPPEDMKILEKKIVQTKLNGYEIKNPYGQKASRIEVSMVVGVSSKQVIERIERTVGNFFHTDTVHFGAFPVAAFSAIRDLYPTDKSFLFLDITGEGTDISLINTDLLAGTVTFPRGKNFFIREISAQFRMPHDVAASVLNMFLGGTLDEKRHKEIEQLMADTEKVWLERFEKALGTLARSGVLSRKIFFMADADTAVLFESMLAKSKEKLNVHYLDQQTFGKFVTFENAVARDPFLTVEALLAAKVIPQLNK
jgi:cell division ATPase FtsA